MMATSKMAERLVEILDLERQPVGVKFVKLDDNNYDFLGNYKSDTKHHYCQALMQASHGRKILLNSENLNCAASSSALGFTSLHPKLASGMAHFNAGTLGTPEAAAKILKEVPRIPENSFSCIILSPLKDIEISPDIVVLEAQPEQLMWLSLASIYTSGERLHYNTAVVQAACVDSTIVPFTSDKINLSLGCVGCRAATDLAINEMIMGIPYHLMEDIMKNLQELHTKVIPDNRNKPGLKRFLKN